MPPLCFSAPPAANSWRRAWGQQFSGAELGNENCKHGYLYSVMRTASLRPLTILPQICTVWCTKLRKHLNAIAKVFYCFTVVIGLPGDVSDYNDDKRSAVAARMQNKVVVKWGNSERQEWDFGYMGRTEAAVKNINDAMCIALLRLMKTKNFNVVFSFCQRCHLTWQNWAKFFGRDVVTLPRWKLP